MNAGSQAVFYQTRHPQAEAYNLFCCTEPRCRFQTYQWLDFSHHSEFMHGICLPKSFTKTLTQGVARVYENTDSGTHSEPAHLHSGVPITKKPRNRPAILKNCAACKFCGVMFFSRKLLESHVLQDHKEQNVEKDQMLKRNTVFCGDCGPRCTFETMEMFYKHNQDVHGTVSPTELDGPLGKQLRIPGHTPLPSVSSVYRQESGAKLKKVQRGEPGRSNRPSPDFLQAPPIRQEVNCNEMHFDYNKSSQGHLSEPPVVQRSSRRSSFWYGPCHICGLKFSTKTLMDHIASHKQYRNKYICSFCKCSFNSIQMLRSHGAKMHNMLRARWTDKGTSGHSRELTDAHDLQHLQNPSNSAYFDKEEWEFNAGNHIEALLGKISKFSGSDKTGVGETVLTDEEAMAAESGIPAECIISKDCTEAMEDQGSQAMPPIGIAASPFGYAAFTGAPGFGETSHPSRCSNVDVDNYAALGNCEDEVVTVGCDETFEISSVQMDREEESKAGLFDLLDDSEGREEGSEEISDLDSQDITGQKGRQTDTSTNCEGDVDGECSLFEKFPLPAVKRRKRKQVA